ncbi:VOC family protein [Candidatus Saccharibacteria bacterium]|nr:VOC family protein [Candidatus Saccharibacteria bacterium]
MGYKDQDRMIKFYESAFGWETQKFGPEMGNYVVAHTTKTDKDGMVQTKGAINGGFYAKTNNPLSQAPSVVLAVEDAKAAVKAIELAGGKVLGSIGQDGKYTLEPQAIPGVGLWISAIDTEDNRFSILQPKT